jgi:predicted RNA-binding protein YlxR (DUF448 family)
MVKMKIRYPTTPTGDPVQIVKRKPAPPRNILELYRVPASWFMDDDKGNYGRGNYICPTCDSSHTSKRGLKIHIDNYHKKK